MAKTRDLLEQRSTIVTRMRNLTDEPAGDDGDLSEEQAAEFTRLKSQLTNLEARLERQQLVDDAERRVAAPAIVNGNGADRFEERARDFSLIKAINAQLGDPVDAGFEREISQEVRSRNPQRDWSGIACPDEYFITEKRVLLAGTTAAELVPEVHRPDLFIDLLRSALVTGRLGATILDNLVGTIDIPRQNATQPAEWLAEDAALTAADAGFDDVTLSPTTVGALTSYSRRTLINALPSVENIVRRDLAARIANAIDAQALLGDGTGNTPVGVANQAGITAASLATPAWDEVLAFAAAIQQDDADLGSLGWAMNFNAVATLRATTKVASDAGAGFLADSPTSMAGFPIVPTSAIPEITGAPNTHQVFFGSWGQLLIGYWSGLDVLANPFSDTAFPRGRVEVRALRDLNVAVRHPESFAHATDLPL